VNTLLSEPAALHRSGALPAGVRQPAHTRSALGGEQVTAANLGSLREADVRRAVQHLAAVDTPVQVARYVLVNPHQDPADRLAETQAVVIRRGWQATITTFDDTGVGEPSCRPQMARLCAALSRGEIHGIVAVSQVDISAFPALYANALADFRARGGFLALARRETSL
jgi:hypothetical protein